METISQDECEARGPRKPGFFDGHVHTNLSTGAPDQTPDEVCRQAKAAGLAHLAITDHNWMLEEPRREALADAWGLDVIAGCELSAEVSIGGKSHIVHIGAHWVDGESPKLRAVLRRNQDQDFEGYVKEMLRRCLRCGLDPSHEGVDRSYQMILERNPDSHLLGKRAVARLLYETGCVPSAAEAKDKYLTAHGERLAYVPSGAFFRFAPLEMVMDAIHESGLSTLNHLYYYRLERDEEDALMGRFRDLGGQALEVVYSRYSEAQRARLLGHCQRFGFLPNCGSDRHTGDKAFLRGDPALFRRLRDRCRELHGTIRGGADHDEA